MESVLTLDSFMRDVQVKIKKMYESFNKYAKKSIHNKRICIDEIRAKRNKFPN